MFLLIRVINRIDRQLEEELAPRAKDAGLTETKVPILPLDHFLQSGALPALHERAGAGP